MLEPVRPVSVGRYNQSFRRGSPSSRRGHAPKTSNQRRRSDRFFLSFPDLHLLNLLERKIIAKYKSLFEGAIFGLKVDIYA
jgi:hypothetical protein